MAEKAKITGDMLIADILQVDAGIAAVLMASGMHCVGCPASQGESLSEAAAVHGLNVEELLGTVNEYLAKK
jgi:hybrid cluster-associated redox disulfide protein